MTRHAVIFAIAAPVGNASRRDGAVVLVKFVIH